MAGVEQPRPIPKRHQWTYPSFFAESLHTIPSVLVPIYVTGQSPEPISVLHFQYQGIAKPVTTPSVAGETVTADKWLTSWPQPSVRPKRLIQYGANCAIAEQADDGTPPVYWLPQPVDSQIRRSRLRDYGLFGKSTVTPTTAESITIDKWFELAERPIDRARNQSIFSVTAKDLIGRAESVSLDRFQQPQSEPRRDASRRQYVYPVSVSDYLSQVPGAEVVRLDKWNRNYPDLIFRARQLRDYGQWTIDPTLTTERASVDKWSQPSNRPRFDPKRYLWLYPSFSSDTQLYVQPGIEIIRVDKWAQETQRPRRAQRRVFGESSVVPLVREAGTISWQQAQSVPRRDMQRLQHLFPYLAIDAAFFIGSSDFGAVSKDIRTAILFTSHVGTGIITISDVGAVQLITDDIDAVTLFTQDVRNEP